jgi:hypothetical protein
LNFKSFLAIQVIFISILNLSCNEDFNPYGDFKEQYALVCVLRDDTSHQVAMLSTSYPPDQQGTENTFLEGADVRVWVGDSVYKFKDTIVTSTNSSVINSPQHYYYNDNFKVSPLKLVEIEVLLQNGRRLKSISESPGAIEFLRESNVTVPTANSNLVKIYWQEQELGYYYLPKLEIIYLHNGELHYKEVPLRFDDIEGSVKAVFPVSSNRNSVIYNLDAVNKTLEQISEADPDKNSYSIYQSLVFSVLVFDNEVSRYISSTAQSKIDLTVTLNFPDYSNISGGLGIFGSMLKANYPSLFFIPDYITGFGYKIILN